MAAQPRLYEVQTDDARARLVKNRRAGLVNLCEISGRVLTTNDHYVLIHVGTERLVPASKPEEPGAHRVVYVNPKHLDTKVLGRFLRSGRGKVTR
jgi:hypothetical protein